MKLSGPATMIDTRLEIGLEPPEDAFMYLHKLQSYDHWLDTYTMRVSTHETKCSGIPKTMHEHSRCLRFRREDPSENEVGL